MLRGPNASTTAGQLQSWRIHSAGSRPSVPGATCRHSSVVSWPTRLRHQRDQEKQHMRSRSPISVSALRLAAQVAGAVALGLPASVIVDAALDRAQDRVGRISNGTAHGTKFYIAGGMDAAAAKQGQKQRPAVVLIHQIFGLQPREAGMCDELALHGFIAVAPDTFQGCATTQIPRALSLAYPIALKPGAHWGVPDIHKVVQWLQQQPGVDPARIAVVGFCYGGGAAIRYAAAHPHAVGAVGVFYGRPLDEAADYARLQAPVLGIYGGRDQQFSEATVDEFEKQLSAAGLAHTIKRFPTEGHAFVTDLAATRQAGSASAEAWAALLQFLGTHLQDV